jgi:YHS domain-containing protein
MAFAKFLFGVVSMILGRLPINKILLVLLIGIIGSGVVSATGYVDPVCKMNGTITNTTNFTSFNHTIYYFCSEMCKNEFIANPEKFLNEPSEEVAIDPVCKMTVNTSTANLTSTYNGTVYYFCKPMCKEEFDANPGKFISLTDDKTAIDPVCNMSVEKATAVNSTYKGVTYYFCSEECKTAFDADPEKYLSHAVS